MSIVATFPVSSKRPSIRARRRRVVIHDYAGFLFLKRHVDLAEGALERAQQARTPARRADAIATVRALGQASAGLFTAHQYGRAVGRLYAEQSARLVEIADAIQELERDHDVVVYLDAVRARRAAKALRA